MLCSTDFDVSLTVTTNLTGRFDLATHAYPPLQTYQSARVSRNGNGEISTFAAQTMAQKSR